MDALGVTYKVMGGPTHCCGVIQLRTGDTEVSGRVATSSLDKLAEGKTGVISWCASCHVQFTEDDDADDRESEGLAAVRDDAVHVVSRDPLRRSCGRC